MKQRTDLSIAELQDIFCDTVIERKDTATLVSVIEDSEQEMYLRHIQMRYGMCRARFKKELQTLSAQAVPTYEFLFNTAALKNSGHEPARKLGWVLENLSSEEPYDFKVN